MVKQSTKKCPKCGNTALVLLTSQNVKVCAEHIKFIYIPWFLDEGQKAIFQ